ncbi:MAG: TRAP transporter substrate-binding protein [Bacillota bacterium]
MRSRRLVFLILMVIAFALLACSCGQKQQPALKEGGQGKEPAKPAQTYTLKMNVIYPPPVFDWEAKKISTEVFAKRVEEATQGRVKIQFFYNSQLAPAAQGLDALKKGVVDLWNGSSSWGGIVPESDVIWLPYGFMGAQHAMHVLRETEVGKIMDEAYQKQGAKILFYWPSGSMVIISKKPVKNFNDIKGMKVRLGYAIWKNWYQRMGAAPINVAVAEQYEALMRGTADATIYPEYTIETYKFHEVCKYVTVPAVVDPGMCYVLVSLNTWNSLPEDLRQTIEKVALEIEKETVPATQRLTEYALESATKKGVQIIKLNRTEFEKYKESAMPAWEEFAARSPQCAQMVKILKEDIKKWEETRPEAKQWYEKWLAK